MSYVIISKQIRTEIGPTLCGDEFQDQSLMNAIGATLQQSPGQHFKHYESVDPPRVVLEKLGRLGYTVVGFTGCGQTVLWTLKK
ncbi:GTP cyclohydrolase 1 feedback regulatory protein-like [Hydractinia symbiolongicarpus]|uniref:GTP cyclohydrolase 1 feedback regulatory protein-like n=1 Tax=Hydractinia symbiolongicarpus TaxID=13093 RepID=UPI002550B0B8|nr:GTP cyclohydrolase 1 feedback regulatory protein-like [Hydractinia symbiolongicarpus]